MKFKNWCKKRLSEEYQVPKIKKEKIKKLNPKTNRIKTSRKTKFYKTNIPPEKRSFDNLPRYANKKPIVRFQDWLELDVKGNYGKSPNGKWYGWSHRAIYGFKPGDKIKKDTIGNNTGKEFILKNDKEAEKMAIAFAKDVS
jgi:hypothetical protein